MQRLIVEAKQRACVAARAVAAATLTASVAAATTTSRGRSSGGGRGRNLTFTALQDNASLGLEAELTESAANGLGGDLLRRAVAAATYGGGIGGSSIQRASIRISFHSVLYFIEEKFFMPSK